MSNKNRYIAAGVALVIALFAGIWAISDYSDNDGYKAHLDEERWHIPTSSSSAAGELLFEMRIQESNREIEKVEAAQKFDSHVGIFAFCCFIGSILLVATRKKEEIDGTLSSATSC